MTKIVCLNPYTESPCGEYDFDTTRSLEAKLAATEKRLLHWRTVSLQERLDHVAAIGKMLSRSRDSLATQMTTEMGKPISQAKAELDKCVNLCEHYEQNGETYRKGREILLEQGSRAKVVAQPLGHILGIMPWNYPVWQVLRLFIPNLVCGNVVSLKHAPNVTGTAFQLAALIREAGLPEGVYTDLYLDNASTEALIGDHRIRGVSLTGSTGAGRAVGAAAGKGLKKAVLELGGSDAYLVCEDADPALAAKACVTSRLINNGQSCIAAKRWIVCDKVYDAFWQQVQIQMDQWTMGDPALESTKVGPLARKDLADKVQSQVQLSLQSGGELTSVAQACPEQGYFVAPGVLQNVGGESPAACDELFGPVATLIQVSDDSQAVAVANSTSYGLGGAVFSDDLERAERLAALLETGTVAINDFVKSHPAVPFGGIGDSGLGRELAVEGVWEFANIKSVVLPERK